MTVRFKPVTSGWKLHVVLLRRTVKNRSNVEGKF